MRSSGQVTCRYRRSGHAVNKNYPEQTRAFVEDMALRMKATMGNWLVRNRRVGDTTEQLMRTFLLEWR